MTNFALSDRVAFLHEAATPYGSLCSRGARYYVFVGAPPRGHSRVSATEPLSWLTGDSPLLFGPIRGNVFLERL